MATEIEVTMHAGDTKTIDIFFKDNGVAVNITGATIRFVIAYNEDAPALVTKETGGSGITIVDGPAGQARVTLGTSDTENLAAGHYYAEAEAIEGGNDWTGIYGRLTILPTSV